MPAKKKLLAFFLVINNSCDFFYWQLFYYQHIVCLQYFVVYNGYCAKKVKYLLLNTLYALKNFIYTHNTTILSQKKVLQSNSLFVRCIGFNIFYLCFVGFAIRCYVSYQIELIKVGNKLRIFGILIH